MDMIFSQCLSSNFVFVSIVVACLFVRTNWRGILLRSTLFSANRGISTENDTVDATLVATDEDQDAAYAREIPLRLQFTRSI